MSNPSKPIVLHFHGFESFNDLETLVMDAVCTMIDGDAETQDTIKITVEKISNPPETKKKQKSSVGSELFNGA